MRRLSALAGLTGLFLAACQPQAKPATNAVSAVQPRSDEAAANAAAAAADVAYANALAAATAASAPSDGATATAPGSDEGGPHEWFVADGTFSRCHKGEPPAERIRTIRQAGLEPQINDGQAPDGTLKVEVGQPAPDGLTTTYVTYYRSLAGCEQALQARNAVPARYE